MTDDDDRIHALLGKHLLGRASDDEVRELRARCDADAAFREAMDAAERSSPHYRRSAIGEDVRLSASDLPDWLRPQELARGLEGWYWRWLLATVVSAVAVWTLLIAAAVTLFPLNDPARSIGVVLLTGPVALAVIVIRARFEREKLAARIASGGPSWERAVAAVRKQEEWFFSPLGHSLMWVGAGLTAAALFVAGTLPRPGCGYALLAAMAALTLTLKIAKGRFLLRGLRGGREWLR